MNNNQVKQFAFLLAVVCGAIGCSSDVTDANSANTDQCLGCETGGASSTTTSPVAHASATNNLTVSTGGATSAPTTGAAGTSQNIAGASATGGSAIETVGGSTPTLVGGNSGVGGSSSTGGRATTGGTTSIGNGNTTSTGGATNACLPLGATCNSSTVCCASGNLATWCQGTCVVQMTQATGGATSTGTGGATSKGGSSATGGATVTTSTGGSNTATGGATQTQCAGQGSPCNSVSDCCIVTGELTCNGTCGIKTTQQGTGGATGTGGNTGTGGSSSAGGSSASVGGSTASTGGNTGTGGSSVCVPTPRPVATSTAPAFTSCGKPVRENLFPESTMNFADRFATIAQNNILALARTFQHSYLWRWNGNAWNQVTTVPNTTYAKSELWAVATNPTGTIELVGGHAECASCSMTPRIFIGFSGTWVEVSAGLPSWGEVIDLRYVENKAYALVNYNNATQIYSLEGTTTPTWTLVQNFEQSVGRRFWATSKNDIFVVGAKTDSTGNPISALMVHFDGCSWNRIAMPTDVTRLFAIHGAQGSVVVIGDTGSGSVRLISNDLTNWTRSDGDASSVSMEISVLMSSPVSVLVGGGSTRTSGNGTGRLTIGGDSWSTSVVDSREVFDLAQIPNTNSYLVASYTEDQTDLQYHPRVYRVTCQ